MVTQSRLDVDPKEISHELNKDWVLFRESRVKRFLTAWVEGRIHNERIALESVDPEKLPYVQGTINGLKNIQILLNNTSVVEDLKRTVDYIEKHYGN